MHQDMQRWKERRMCERKKRERERDKPSLAPVVMVISVSGSSLRPQKGE